MSIVNFSVPKKLEQRITQTVEAKGFASKAEFFRLAAISFIENLDNTIKETDEQKTTRLVSEIKNIVTQNYQNKDTDSLKDQLQDL